MTTRLHRLWVPGAPQRRVFLPNFWMKLVRPEPPLKLPPNVVLFHVSPQMSHWDVKEYLQKVQSSLLSLSSSFGVSESPEILGFASFPGRTEKNCKK